MMPRRCEVQTPDGWHAHVFAALIPGMVFRLFEEDGAPVTDADGVFWPGGERSGAPSRLR